MLKVINLEEVKPYYIICNLSNGERRRLDILPLMEKYKKLEGIERLKDSQTFQSALVGVMGEVFWKDIILVDNEKWNFDISPEFIFYNGIKVAD